MRVQPVLLEDVQVQERIPSRCDLGEGVSLAREWVEPIKTHAVAPLDVPQGRLVNGRAEGGPRLAAQQSAPLIAVLDGLREADALGQAQRWTPPSARAHGLAIGAQHLLWIGSPAVAAPGERLPC